MKFDWQVLVYTFHIRLSWICMSSWKWNLQRDIAQHLCFYLVCWAQIIYERKARNVVTFLENFFHGQMNNCLLGQVSRNIRHWHNCCSCIHCRQLTIQCTTTSLRQRWRLLLGTNQISPTTAQTLTSTSNQFGEEERLDMVLTQTQPQPTKSFSFNALLCINILLLGCGSVNSVVLRKHCHNYLQCPFF